MEIASHPVLFGQPIALPGSFTHPGDGTRGGLYGVKKHPQQNLSELEAVVVPVTVVGRNELGRTETGDGLAAADALLGEPFSETVGTERLLVARRELLADEHLVTPVAREALAVPRRSLVRYSAFVDHSVALDTALGVLLLVARDTDCFLVTWYEGLDADWLPTNLAAETLLVKLFPLELILLHTCSEDVGASVTAQREVVVMAVGTVSLVILTGERLVD
jgi:hypothetical protein